MPKILENEKIYHAVMQVVAERGYTGATTKEMAIAANVSEVTLFRKYGSKQKLVKQAISSIISRTNLASAAHYTGDIKTDLTRMVQAYEDAALKHGGFVSSILSEISRHPELVDSIEEPLYVFMAMAEIIARYQDQGELQNGQPLHILAALLGPVMYTAIMRSVIHDTTLLPPFDISTHVAHFLKGHST